MAKKATIVLPHPTSPCIHFSFVPKLNYYHAQYCLQLSMLATSGPGREVASQPLLKLDHAAMFLFHLQESSSSNGPDLCTSAPSMVRFQSLAKRRTHLARFSPGDQELGAPDGVSPDKWKEEWGTGCACSSLSMGAGVFMSSRISARTFS